MRKLFSRLFKKKITTATILSSFHTQIDKLEVLEMNRYDEFHRKTGLAEALLSEADKDQQEAEQARAIADKIRALVA